MRVLGKNRAGTGKERRITVVRRGSVACSARVTSKRRGRNSLMTVGGEGSCRPCVC
jgi:hypothetical protein